MSQKELVKSKYITFFVFYWLFSFDPNRTQFEIILKKTKKVSTFELFENALKNQIV